MVKRKRDLSAALNEIHSAKKKVTSKRLMNPFEAKPNKRVKHKVLNKAMKGSERNVALARSLAHEKRKRTLLEDFKASSKANSFADKRFGESDVKLTDEEKILERFKKIRSKKSLYDLSDTDKNKASTSVGLTHLGQSLGAENNDISAKEAREFEERLREEDLDEEDMFGQMDASELMDAIKRGDQSMLTDMKRSKKEVMEDVIAKAKLYKMQRQKEKEEDEEERERLDDMFKGLMQDGMFHMRPTKHERQQDEMKEMLERMESGDKSLRKTQKDEDRFERDEYEQTVAKLMFEARAAATDRTMSAEEKANRELEKLKEQQEDLQKRKEGRFDMDDDWEEEQQAKKKKRRKKIKEENEEEEEEVFSERKVPMDSYGNEIEVEISEDDLDESSEDSDEDSEEVSEAENSDESNKAPKKSKTERENEIYAKRTAIMNQAKGELPFVIECPDSHISFLELLLKYPNEPLQTIITRIRKSNSVFLGAVNREKMKVFLEVIIGHLSFLQEHDLEGKAESIKTCLCALFDIAADIPDVASQVFCSHLGVLQMRFSKHRTNAFQQGPEWAGDYGSLSTKIAASTNTSSRKKGGHKGIKGKSVLEQEKLDEAYELEMFLGGTIVSESRCWPSAGDLTFFRAVESVFPVTDFRHLVVSPCQLLLAQYILQSPLRGPRDVQACMYTCQVLIDFSIQAKRLAPEVIIALEVLLASCFLPSGDENCVLMPQMLKQCREQKLGSMEWLFEGCKGLLSGKSSKDTAIWNLAGLSYGDVQTDSYSSLNVLSALCKLCSSVSTIQREDPCCEILLGGICNLLSTGVGQLKGKKRTGVHSELEHALQDVQSAIKFSLEKREPMRLLETKARSIQIINPMFNENYKWTKDGHDADKTRVETKRLKKEVKKERKVVARELRKDAVFLSEYKGQEKQKHSTALREERQKNYNFVMEQAGIINKAVREYGAKGGGATGVDMKGRKR